MKKINLLIFTFLLCSNVLISQVAINTTGEQAEASSMFEVKSTEKGMLIPRMSKAQRDLISSPVTGLLIYQNDNTPGFYFYNGTAWVVVGDGAISINNLSDGSTDGNSVFLGGGAGSNDDGTTNYNTATGVFALKETTSGDYNSAFGTEALRNIITGTYNTGFGRASLLHNVSGNYNVALGANAGYSLTGSGNILIGYNVAFNETAISNRLYIENSHSSTPLIYGEFDNDKVRINGRFEVSDTVKIEAPAIMNQVSMNTDGSTPDSSAILDLKSTSLGFLPPRMTASQMNSISGPASGLSVFNTDVNALCVYNGSEWDCMDAQSLFNKTFFCGDNLKDYRDGKSYTTVQIGTQCWMAENLNVGTRIDGSSNQTDNDTIEKYCYNDTTINCDTYGGLYQWDEMMQYVTTEGVEGICPPGWHLPTDDEWKTLEMELGMSSTEANNTEWRGTNEGSKLAGNEPLWLDGNLDQDSDFGTSGFVGLPGGFVFPGGSFMNLTNSAFFWVSSEETVTEAWSRSLNYDYTKVGRDETGGKDFGLSVRCVRD